LLQELNAVSVATATAVRRFSAPGGFRVLPVVDPIGSEQLGVVSLTQIAMEPTAQLFLDIIKEIAAEGVSDHPTE
jgi:DNA-binding transcriptional LysR family regulator